jgi:hypothetical protein
MHSRQYVAQDATGCSVKGKTIVKFVLAMVFLFDELLRAERQSKHDYPTCPSTVAQGES